MLEMKEKRYHVGFEPGGGLESAENNSRWSKKIWSKRTRKMIAKNPRDDVARSPSLVNAYEKKKNSTSKVDTKKESRTVALGFRCWKGRNVQEKSLITNRSCWFSVDLGKKAPDDLAGFWDQNQGRRDKKSTILKMWDRQFWKFEPKNAKLQKFHVSELLVPTPRSNSSFQFLAFGHCISSHHASHLVSPCEWIIA